MKKTSFFTFPPMFAYDNPPPAVEDEWPIYGQPLPGHQNLFVYGTLMKGRGNGRFLKNGTFISNGRTKEFFNFGSCGIPFVYDREVSPPTEKYSGFISGEIWSINQEDLTEIDLLEGHPHTYKRKMIDIIRDDNTMINCWCYLYQHRGPKQKPTLGGRHQW